MAEKTWVSISQGSGKFVKWTALPTGATLEGTLVRGIHAGKYGDLVDLKTADGVVTVPVPIGLKDIRRVRVGAVVLIEHRGLVPTKNGHECRAFIVSVADPATDLVDEPAGED